MKAIQQKQLGPPNVLKLVDLPDPKPDVDEVLIRVETVGVNFHDLALRVGFPGIAKLPVIHGIELAGKIVELGSEVDHGFKTGDRVMAIPLYQHGGYAEYVTVPSDFVYRVPDTMTMKEAAAFPINYLMAFAALYFTARPRKGDQVLIQGAAGGVGLAAVQLTQPMDVTLFGTSSSFKHNVLKENGVDYPIDYRLTDFEEEIQKLTNGKGVDVILDGIGENGYMKSLRSLGYGGRLVCFGATNFFDDSKTIEDENIERYQGIKFPFDEINIQARSIMTSHLGAPPEQLKDWMKKLLEFYESGIIQPRVDKIFPLSEAAAAHTYIHERNNIGKVILAI